MADPARTATWKRRAISIPTVTLALLVVVPTLGVTLPRALLWDLVRGRPLPTVRMLLFGTAYLMWEVTAVAIATGIWLMCGFGLGLRRPWSISAHQRLQARWVHSLLGLAESLLRLRIEVDGQATLAKGPIILLSRHASMVDTLIPARLLTDSGMALRYVMKTELLWDPALDIIGHRLPNHFVDRSGSNSATETAAIERLADGATESEAIVIFPEGTRWTPAKRATAQARLEASDPELARRLEGCVDTMPPRPGGTLAAMAGAAHADVVLMAHTGLEGLAGPADALRMVPFRSPVRIRLWRVPRSEIPTAEADRITWLVDQWIEIDRWVTQHRLPN